MSITRRSGSFSAITIVLALSICVAAAALVGCGGTAEHPGGPSGTGVSEEQAKLAVAKGDKAAITEALNGAGITGNELYLYMNYTSSAKDAVEVMGELKRDGASLTKVVLTKSGDGWAVASAE